MKRLIAALLLPALIATAAIAGKLAALPPVEEMSLASMDLFQRLAPRPTPDPPVLIVDIDARSLRELGRWPWPRTLLATLTDKLAAAGATVVGFDLVFPEPDRTPPRLPPLLYGDKPPPEIARPVEGPPDHDKVFADAIRRAPVVLGSLPGAPGSVDKAMVKAGFAFAGDDPLQLAPSYSGAVVSLPELEIAAAGVGGLDEDTDQDGIVRRMRLVERVSGGPYPSFVAEILRVGLGSRSYIGRAAATGSAPNRVGTAGLVAIKIGSLVIPTDERGRMWIAFRPLDRDRWISAADILAGKFDPADLKDRIVLVSASAPGGGDPRATPLGVSLPSVEIQAQAIDQAVQEWFLTRPTWASGAEMLFIAAAVFGAALLLYFFDALKAGILAAYALAFAWGLSWWGFRAADLLFDPIYPSLVIPLAYVSSTVLTYGWAPRKTRTDKVISSLAPR